MPQLTEVEWESIKDLFESEKWYEKKGMARKFHQRVLEKLPYIDISMSGLYLKTKEWKKNFAQKNKQTEQNEVNKKTTVQKKTKHKKDTLQKLDRKGIEPELVKKIDKKNGVHWDRDRVYKLYLNKPIDMTDVDFCAKHNIPIDTLKGWKMKDDKLIEMQSDFQKKAMELLVDKAIKHLEEHLPEMLINDAREEGIRGDMLEAYENELKSIKDFREKLSFASPQEVDKYQKIMATIKMTDGTRTIDKILKFNQMLNKNKETEINIQNVNQNANINKIKQDLTVDDILDELEEKI